MHDIKAIRKRIKEVVKFIWSHEIPYDYKYDMILREDSMKASLYHHLRDYFKYEIENDILRIYTEYHIRGTKAFADIVIADFDNKKFEEINTYGGDWKDASMPIAVFELKISGRKNGKDKFIADINKVIDIQASNVLPNCDYYLAHISEYDHGQLFFLDKSHKKNFFITELAAMYNSKAENEDESMIWKSH